MKTRNGFVSNSSSSSFSIMLKDITAEQLQKIKNHAEEGKEMGIQYADTDTWSIDVTEHSVNGSTWMDNFDMREFLEKIGVPGDKIEWDGENC